MTAPLEELTARHRVFVPATPPFSLACSARAMDGFAPCSGDQLVTGSRVRRSFVHPDDLTRAVVVEVSPPVGDTPGVDLTTYADEPLGDAGLAGVIALVERWLGLTEDRAAFLSIARGDPAMTPLLAIAEGLHQVRFASLAEGAAYFTLSQRSAQWFAAARKRRIAAELGPRGIVDGVSYVAFPALPTLADLTATQLVGYAGSRQRAERLRGVFAGLAALDEEWLRVAPYGEARKALLDIPGIGEFTAHAILLRVLGRPDDVPLEAQQFVGVAARLYGDPPPTPDQLRERYGPWVGWWAYLARTAIGWLPKPEPDPQPDLEPEAEAEPTAGSDTARRVNLADLSLADRR